MVEECFLNVPQKLQLFLQSTGYYVVTVQCLFLRQKWTGNIHFEKIILTD